MPLTFPIPVSYTHLHVVDLAKGHVAALKKIQKGSGLNVYNLGTGKGLSLIHIFRCKFVDSPSGDVAQGNCPFDHYFALDCGD